MATLTWSYLFGDDGYDERMPPLLIAHSFRDQAYQVYVTDLKNFWAETMDKRSIIKRALVTDTSIDPTEDDEQMKLLLDKIKHGLDHGKDAAVELIVGADEDEYTDEDDHLLPMEIKMVIDLPKPFEPLRWTVKLQPCSSSWLLEYMTVPLIMGHFDATGQRDQLMAVIKEKDHVIQKLADKLEASGTELGQVFPSAAGKGGRKLTRKTVEARVAGLAPFEYQSWRKEFKRTESSDEFYGAEFYNQVMLRCFQLEPLKLPYASHAWDEGWEKWWADLKGEPLSMKQGWDKTYAEIDAKEHGEKAPRKKAPTTSEESKEDLQIPATPPAASHKSKRSPTRHSDSRHAIDEAETDDEDLDAASQSQLNKVSVSFISPHKQAFEPPAKKLGGIGGKKTAAKAKAATPPRAQPARSSQSLTVADDDSTEGEDEFEEAQPKKSTPERRAASPTPPPVKTSPKKTPKKGGLGKIGGKKKAASPPAEPDDHDETHLEGSQMPSRGKEKLGHVGARKDEHEDDGRGRSDEKEEQQPRETSADARQRRKREMQDRLEKEAARPKKKKRVF